MDVNRSIALVIFADFEVSFNTVADQIRDSGDPSLQAVRPIVYTGSGERSPGTISDADIGMSTVRRLEFFVDRTGMPCLLAPLAAHYLWSRGRPQNLVFSYPGIPAHQVLAAAKMLSDGVEAVLLRDDTEQCIVLGIAENTRNRRLVTHWADSVERFSREPDAQKTFGPSLGGMAVNYLCDRICSFRAPAGWSFAPKNVDSGTASKVGRNLIHAAVRKLMPLSEALMDDPAANAIVALNEPAAGVQQEAGCLVTELMVFVREQRRDLQEAFDLANPEQRRGFVQWFLTRAGLEFEVCPEFIEPVRAACLLQQDTNKPVEVPLRQHPERQDDLRGVNLVGYPRAEMGMGEQIRGCATSLEAVGSEFSLVDFNFGIVASQADRRYDHLLRSDNPFPVNLFHINADQIPLAAEKLGLGFFRGRYNVGYWEWELGKFPRQWLSSLDRMDEIWAPSTFIESAVSGRTTKPVIWMPLAVECDTPEADPAATRTKFDLPIGPYLFLFSFDFSSFATRKNFRAALEAFRRAFPDKQQRVGLVLKTIRRAHHQREFWELLREVADDERIFLIDRVLRQHEMRALTDCCDSFLSLHRSEGFGLGIAEAMYLGKPVIATNYSGNTDFTLPDNSCLVDYKLIPVKEGEYVFPEGQVWADPDIEHAASYMQRLVADREYGAKLGRAAAAFIRKHHSFKAVGTRYVKRLKQIEVARNILATQDEENPGLVRSFTNKLRLPRGF